MDMYHQEQRVQPRVPDKAKAAAEKIGYPYHSNATWLVVVEEGHKLYGGFLTDEALGIGTENKPVVYTGEGFSVNDAV
jgi:tetrathionate reductase subunit A